MGQLFAAGNDAAATPSGEKAEFSFLEGVSPSMRAVEVVIRELAQSDVPVLILAEAGTGKRTTARRIHLMSRHRGEEFHGAACSVLGAEAFLQDPAGVFQPGTLYLEEIGDLSPLCQVKLLEILPKVEGNSMTRLICGSARNLEAEVRSGRLREDLYYRISGVCLRLPPLRQRKQDISYLVSFFLAKYAADFGRPMPVLSAETQRLLEEYGWPGNIRELENAAKAIVALGNESVAMGGLRSLLRRSAPGAGQRISLKQAARAASREAEKELILKALTRTRWNRRRAAQELQISYKALLYKLKQIGYGEYGAS